jgi:predicted nucleic-acid-binding protein
MAASLDTNVLVRFALVDIPEQTEAAKQLIIESGDSFEVADEVIIELEYVLTTHYKFTRQQAAEVIRSILMESTIEANGPLFDAVLETYELWPKLSLSDCYLAERASRRSATPLFTFDKKLAHQHPAAELVPLAGRSGRG